MNEQEQKEQDQGQGFFYFIRQKFFHLWLWVRPDPADPLSLQIIKTFFRGIVALVLIALSPLVLLILGFIFFATL